MRGRLDVENLRIVVDIAGDHLAAELVETPHVAIRDVIGPPETRVTLTQAPPEYL
jgi:hypothetical protein